MKKSKQIKLDEYYIKYQKVYKDKKIIRGCGNIDTSIMFVGEAPGKEELIKNKPFVGKAGKKLEEFLKNLDLGRDDIYITNAIKYGLRKYNENTSRYSNRPARADEIDENMDYLNEEINIIRPQILVTLGNVPLKTVFKDRKTSIGKVHGKIIKKENYLIFPLYHPASLIYNPKLKGDFDKDIDALKIYLRNLKKTHSLP